MEWAPVDAGEHSGVEESKARLLALGVPDYVLNDLTAEDLAACDGAILVVVDVDDYPVNSGRRVSHSYWIGGERHTNIHTVYDVKELRITGVGVELPGERWMLIQHFLWTTPPGFCGTESIQLWPAYRAGMEGWRSGGALTGRVLYDEGGQTYAAPYCFLGEQTFAYDSLFWGQQIRDDLFAAFSLPRDGENCRGYVAYPIERVRDGYIVDGWFNYTHQQSWMQYPVMTAMENQMTNGWNWEGGFYEVSTALQFYQNEEGVRLLG